MAMVVPYLACEMIGGVLGAAMAKVNLPHVYLGKVPSYCVHSELNPGSISSNRP